MNNNQKFIANLLSCAIRGKRPDKIEYCDIDWYSVYKEALEHKVQDLLYPTIKELDQKLLPDNETFKKWNESALFSGLVQAAEIDNMEKVLSLFNKEGIPVIALKGLLLRDLYPQPLLRSMSDADILIQEEDFDKAKSLLCSLGYYTVDDTNLKEVRFFHKTHMLIELHWLLIEPDYIKNTDKFERDVWNNKEGALLGNTPAQGLSTEDNIIYLCMHMLLHFKYRGFGLRQLCDLVLLIEAKKGEIDWSRLSARLESFGIVKFVYYLLLVCKELLEFEIPYAFYKSQDVDINLLNLLVDDIFESGIYGFKNKSRDYITKLIDRIGNTPDSLPKSFNLYMNSIFPTRKLLADRYKYAKKCFLLLPVAWIHRFFDYLIKGNLIDEYKTHVLIPKGTKNEYAKRVELFRKLDLH